MSTTVTPSVITPPGETEKPFDPKEFIRKANEREAAIRSGKQPIPEEKPVAATAQPSVEQTPQGRRARERAYREALRTQGALEERASRAEAELERLRKSGETPPPTVAKPPEDSEPQRTAYKTDAEYMRALGRWEGRQGAREEVQKIERTEAQKAQLAAYQAAARSASEKYQEDKKQFEDWDDVIAEAEETPALDFNFDEHPVLMSLIALSKNRAAWYYHCAKNPEAFKELLALKNRPEDLIAAFKELEGEVKVLYRKEKKEAKVEEKAKTAAERDAAKPAPSESVRVSTGTAAPQATPRTIKGKNGRDTVNPQWMREENERLGVRP